MQWYLVFSTDKECCYIARRKVLYWYRDFLPVKVVLFTLSDCLSGKSSTVRYISSAKVLLIESHHIVAFCFCQKLSLENSDSNRVLSKSFRWALALWSFIECIYRCVLPSSSKSSSSPLYSIRRLQGWALLQNTSCVAFSQKTGKLSVGNTPTFHHHHHRGCAGKKIENCKFLANPKQFGLEDWWPVPRSHNSKPSPVCHLDRKHHKCARPYYTVWLKN